MQNDLLHRYFAGVIKLRHLLQAQESFVDGWKKLPVPQRFLWLLTPLSFAAAAVAMLLPVLRTKKEQRERQKRFPFT